MNGQVVIVGAGVAGLTLAERLVKAGIRPLLVEIEDSVGGLARSFRYGNGAIFDIGPHRFHTDDAQVRKYIEDILAGNIVTIDRDSQLFLFGKYLPWPITLRTAFALPPLMLMRAGLDLFMPRKARTESFEDYIIERYGHTLYRVFFKPYTEKFLDYTCSNLHRDWAEAGINRATIDKQVKTNSLGALIRSVLFSKNPQTKFLYPKLGGCGAFCDTLAERVRAGGGRILLSSKVTALRTDSAGCITAVQVNGSEEVPADFVFWSGGLDDLSEVGNAPRRLPRMYYTSTVLYNYLVKGRISQGFQWCYFGDRDMEVARVSVPRNFSTYTVPEGREALCIEVTCTEDSHYWSEPARFDCVVETFLLHAKLIESLDSVEDVHIEKIRRTYPLYQLNYQRKLADTMRWVAGTWKNLALLGRTGRFWYNNMDHSIAAALDIAGRMTADYKAGALKGAENYAAEDRSLGA